MANGSSSGLYNTNECTSNSPSLNTSFNTVSQTPRFYTICLLILLTLSTCSAASLKSSCKKVGYRSVIDEQGCDLVAVYVNKCSGYCLSLSFKNPLQQNELSIHAKCCRMMDVEMIDVEVKCGGEVRLVKIPSATECGCFDCA